MSQSGKGVVPKFGSFKLKAAPKISQDQKTIQQAKDRHRQRSRSRDRDHHKRKKSLSEERERSRHHAAAKGHTSRHHKREPRNPSPVPVIAKDEFEESDLFIIDRRGDKKNLEYGGLHRYDIPAHYRHGNGRILGTARNIRVDRAASTEKQTALTSPGKPNGERSARPFASKAKMQEPRGLRLILPTSAADQLDVEADYIELRPSLKRKRGSESTSHVMEDVDYRSIEGKAKIEPAPEDEDMEYTSGSDDGEAADATNRAARERNGVLSRKVKDNTGDVEAWLALIEHRATVILPGHDPSSYTSSQRRTLADIRLAIYNRALKSVNKSSPGYDKLVLGRLKEGSTIWDTAKLTTKWTVALKENPTSIAVWAKYLDFIQSDHVNFRFEMCKKAYIECFRMLHKAHAHASPEKLAKVLSTQVYVLLRYTSFIRDTGYDELAHATWQIVLECQFFKPPDLSSGDDILESLEAFWESDGSRIGEEGAEGWSSFHSGDSQGSRKSNVASKGPQDAKVPQQGLVERGSKAMDSFHLPAAADDEADSDDPFRFVMFADMRDVVESLLNDLPKLELINAFLCFMQLPPSALLDSHTPRASYWTDPFLHQPTNVFQQQWPTSADLSHIAHVKYEKATPFNLFHSSFSNLQRSSSLGREKPSAALSFVDHVLQRLVAVIGDSDDLAEYYLAFSLNLFPDKATKHAKKLLKLHSSSLRLYNAYALIEAEQDNVEKAEDVWATALKLSSAWPEHRHKDSILLIHSRTKALMRHGQDAKAIRYLIDASKNQDPASLADESVISATERLKVAEMLSDGFESMRPSKMPERATLYVDCLAWFSYLANDHDLGAALAVYEKYLTKLSSTVDTLALELLHQVRAELLRIHVENKRPYKPVLVRDVMAESIRLFADNSAFYQGQALVSSQTRIDDRLRDALGQYTRPHLQMGLISWGYTIAREIQRCSTDGSGATVNSVRALFSTALLNADSEARHSPELWMLWFEFEQLVADTARVKQVFFDGLRCFPWYKPWIVMGMTIFAESSGEMQRLYDVMTEREIRIRTGFEI